MVRTVANGKRKCDRAIGHRAARHCEHTDAGTASGAAGCEPCTKGGIASCGTSCARARCHDRACTEAGTAIPRSPAHPPVRPSFHSPSPLLSPLPPFSFPSPSLSLLLLLCSTCGVVDGLVLPHEDRRDLGREAAEHLAARVEEAPHRRERRRRLFVAHARACSVSARARQWRAARTRDRP